jgi:hypothetical protein
LANVLKFAILIKIKKASDENLQDAAAGLGHFNDGQLRFRPDLDADQRTKHELVIRRFFSGWKYIGSSGKFFRFST